GANWPGPAASTVPAGGALTVNGTAATGGSSVSHSTSGTFTIGTRTNWDETASSSESGLASSTLTVRSAGFSSADTCDTYGSPTTINGNPDQTCLTSGCYLYTLTCTYNVGNAVSVSTTVKVDTSNPTISLSFANATGGSYYQSGSRVYFKSDAPSGQFDVTATVADVDSGIAGTAFPTAADMGANWSIPASTSTSRTYRYVATGSAPGTQSVTVTNGAGRTASASFDVVDDTNAPGGGALTVNGTTATGGGSVSYSTSGDFTIGTRTDWTESQTASASGLAASTVWFRPAGSGSFDVTASSSDDDTGIQDYTFPTAGAMGASWTPSGSGATRTYTFSAGDAEPASQTVTATNNAGRTANSSFTVSADSTAPTTSTTCNSGSCAG